MSTLPRDTTAQDARWLRDAGVRRCVHAGEEVIRAGDLPEYLFVVLEGELEVAESPPYAAQRLGPGVLLWESADLQPVAAGRSVHAATDAVLLCVRPGDVEARVQHDPSFGERFLRLRPDFALEHVSGGAPDPAAAARDGSAPPPGDFRVPDVIEKLLRGEF